MALAETRKRVVFVGGGHAHLYSLARTRDYLEAGVDLALVAPDRFHYYSGMGPGMLSGIYSPDEIRFDVEEMVRSRGGTFVRGRVARVHAGERLLELEDGARVAYNWASFNTGSRVPVERIPAAAAEAIPVKPIENLQEARKAILAAAEHRTPRVVIIGAGPAGVELAGNVGRLLRSVGAQGAIYLLEASDRLLPGFPRLASRVAFRSLAARDVQIRTGFAITSLADGAARSGDGKEIPYDIAILTIGIVSHPIYAPSGLRTGPDGALLVNRFLQCVDHPELFGGGDGVWMEGRALPRVGVYAVRQAPILHQNLLASVRGKTAELRAFEPQRRYLLILNLGDGTGLAVWGPLVLHSPLMLRWKTHLDTSFMAVYRGAGQEGHACGF